MHGMLWREEVIENDIENEMKMNQRDNCIKSDIWSDLILLLRITLFCDQGCKSEGLKERRNIM